MGRGFLCFRALVCPPIGLLTNFFLFSGCYLDFLLSLDFRERLFAGFSDLSVMIHFCKNIDKLYFMMKNLQNILWHLIEFR